MTLRRRRGQSVDPVVRRFGESADSSRAVLLSLAGSVRRFRRRRTAAATRRVVARHCASGSDAGAPPPRQIGDFRSRRRRDASAVFNRVSRVKVCAPPGLQSPWITGNYCAREREARRQTPSCSYQMRPLMKDIRMKTRLVTPQHVCESAVHFLKPRCYVENFCCRTLLVFCVFEFELRRKKENEKYRLTYTLLFLLSRQKILVM